MIITQDEQKKLAETLAKACDGVAFWHSTYGWIVSTGEELIDAFSCEILTADSKPVQIVDNRISRVLQEREQVQEWETL